MLHVLNNLPRGASAQVNSLGGDSGSLTRYEIVTDCVKADDQLILRVPQAVGEPPLFLACAAMFAIRDAVVAARQEEGLEGWFPMDAPATAATIRLACEDSLTRKVGSAHEAHSLQSSSGGR